MTPLGLGRLYGQDCVPISVVLVDEGNSQSDFLDDGRIRENLIDGLSVA
jgi:hypothetical protein